MAAVTTSPTIQPFGDAAVVVDYGETIDRALSAEVIALDARVAAARIPGVIEAVPSFRSLLVTLDPLATEPAAVIEALQALTRAAPGEAAGEARVWRLPCCYDPDLALDLEGVAAQTGLTPDKVVALHADCAHHVYMLGFLPGTPYLGDLPEPLRIPRRAEPRLRLPQGSVATATGLTVIYPVESPGGWSVIGRSPAPLFSLDQAPPALLAPGDTVRFEPISRAEYDRLFAAAQAGEWRPEPEKAPANAPEHAPERGAP